MDSRFFEFTILLFINPWFLSKISRFDDKLNHLHDCVMLHPNDVDSFYGIVTEVFCSPQMLTLADDLFFSRVKKDLVGDSLKVVLKLEKQFIENMDDFEINPETFDPRKCYRYEGTK